MSNPHDSFFQYALSIPSLVRQFIEFLLPKEFVSLIDLSSIKEDTSNYRTRGGRQLFSDKVFSCNFKAKGLLAVTILKEHKSYFDENAVFQILEYISGIWRKQIKSKKTLTPVFAVLFTHGKHEWKYKDILDFFSELPDWLAPYQPQFKICLVDVQRFTDEFILNLPEGYLKNLLYIFKHHHEKEVLWENIDATFIHFEKYLKTDEGKNFIQELFVYFIELMQIAVEEVEKKIDRAFPQNLKPIVMGTATMLRLKGREEGKIEGKIEGLEHSATHLILKLPLKSENEMADLIGVDVSFIKTVKEKMIKAVTNALKEKPSASPNTIAKNLGYTEEFVKTVKNSLLN